MNKLVTQTDLSDLNAKQVEAVISEEKRLLVLAGAGSGKTKTLIQKLEYLIKDKGVKTSEILAITFTKNAANEMVDRLILSADSTGEYNKILHSKKKKQEIDFLRSQFLQKNKWVNSLTVCTFHSLCYQLCKTYSEKGTAEEFDDNKFRLITDAKSAEEDFTGITSAETRQKVLANVLFQKCQNKDYLLKFKRYVLDYLVDRIDSLPEQSERRNYKKFFTTLNGTKVSSKSEQYIADWLYRHNIQFVYEPYINLGNFNFKPDFYIKDSHIYLEHVSDKSYPMKDKEEEFEQAGKILIRTYETQTKDTNVFNLVLDRCIKNKLPKNALLDADINYEEEFKYYHKFINDFIRQVLSVMDMIKTENFSLDDIFKKAQKESHERVRLFYEFAIPIIKDYNNYCNDKSYMDFNDLVLQALKLLNIEDIGKVIRNKYKYILVDEFQDVNNLQVDLINKLITNETQLFCVGDDWQSIYGFRGSNVNYIVEFQKHFKNAHCIKLDTNYRSTHNIVNASSEVIKNNEVRVDKVVKAFKETNSAIHVFAGQDENENIDYAIKQVQKLVDQGFSKEDIMFLYRRTKMFTPYSDALYKAGLFVQGRTIHGSKGLEAKAVFVIGLTEGQGGFPDVWLSDMIYQLIKKTKHNVLLEEERRLFYVAMTRAKDHLFLMTQRDNQSRFIDEVPRKYTQSSFDSMAEKTIIFTCTVCEKVVDSFDNFCRNCGASLKEENFGVSDRQIELIEKEKTPEHIIEARKKHTNAFAKWTEELDKELEGLHAKGKGVEDLMQHFGRSRSAIEARLIRLGLES